jgi:hypothetical protein
MSHYMQTFRYSAHSVDDQRLLSKLGTSASLFLASEKAKTKQQVSCPSINCRNYNRHSSTVCPASLIKLFVVTSTT